MFFLDPVSPHFNSKLLARVVFLKHVSDHIVLCKIPQEHPKIFRLLPWHLSSSWPTFYFSLISYVPYILAFLTSSTGALTSLFVDFIHAIPSALLPG